MDVVLVRWPEENLHLGELRGAGTPRLLLVGPEAAPPDSVDPLEDWIRLPADDRDVRARVATLEARASNGMAVPEIDDDGLLRFRDRWVSLSPVERELAGSLVERFGAVVGRELMARRGVADRRADPQRARRAHPPAAPPHRAARTRGPHRSLSGLPPADHHA